MKWKDEIESKTNELFSTHIHHGVAKLKTIAALQEHDIIITTYHTLLGDFTAPTNVVEDGSEREWLRENGQVQPSHLVAWSLIDFDIVGYLHAWNGIEQY